MLGDELRHAAVIASVPVVLCMGLSLWLGLGGDVEFLLVPSPLAVAGTGALLCYLTILLLRLQWAQRSP